MLSKLALDLCCVGFVASRFGSERCLTSNGDKSIHTLLPIRFDLNSVTHPLTLLLFTLTRSEKTFSLLVAPSGSSFTFFWPGFLQKKIYIWKDEKIWPRLSWPHTSCCWLFIFSKNVDCHILHVFVLHCGSQLLLKTTQHCKNTKS